MKWFAFVVILFVVVSTFIEDFSRVSALAEWPYDSRGLCDMENVQPAFRAGEWKKQFRRPEYWW
ncbi:unnamed protein product [Tenebrio molitor]|nr:unnamed protein product [Tenebrio molitor]